MVVMTPSDPLLCSYEYVDQYRECYRRPAVWMPRPSEFTREGRNDLKLAINRFGGPTKICRLAGLVPYREWYYLEGQLEMLVELQRYLDEHAASDYRSFPTVLDMKVHGYEHLYSLVQYYGGRKFLAARLGMQSNINKSGLDDDGMNWGPFDLLFAVGLLQYVREGQLRKNPPLTNPALAIPSREKLLQSGDDGDAWLDAKITARRLGLAFFPERANRTY
jgi:hypothetical protein